MQTKPQEETETDIFQEYPALPKELSVVVQRQNLRIKNMQMQVNTLQSEKLNLQDQLSNKDSKHTVEMQRMNG